MEMLLQLLTPRNVLLLVAIVVILRMGIEYYRRKTHRFVSFLIGTCSGIAALLLLHFYGGVIHFTPPLTIYTVFVAAGAGIPGVGLLYLMELLQY